MEEKEENELAELEVELAEEEKMRKRKKIY